MDPLVAFILQVLGIGGGAAVVAYLAFKHLGMAWLDQHFKARLKQLEIDADRELTSRQLDHEKELVRLRMDIDALLKRRDSLAIRELEVLPTAWAHFVDAHDALAALTAPLRTSYDFALLDERKSELLLKQMNLRDWQADDIRAATTAKRKGELFDQFVVQNQAHAARMAGRRFYEYATKNSVFMPPEIRDACNNLAEKLHQTITTSEIGYDARNYEMQIKAWETYRGEIGRLRTALQDAMQRYLFRESEPAGRP